MGRPKTGYKTGHETKEKLLDSAEALFADNGFEGTSVREISKVAGIQLAAISYHFGGKENLFEEVISRRSNHIGSLRRQALNQNPGPLSIRNLVEGYTHPFIERAINGDQGWRNYARLIANVANSPKWTHLVSRNYDDVAERYLKEFYHLLPNASHESVVNGFDFMVGSMLTVCAQTGRMEELSGIKKRNLETTLSAVSQFFSSGFESLK